jgi:HD-like signal output (HDOD) protein
MMSSSEPESFESLLGQLTPIKSLPNSLERRLLQRARVINTGRRQRLSSHAEHNWMLYLLEGTLKVANASGSEAITVPSSRSLRPVFSGQSLSEVALTQSDTRILKIDRQYYELLLREQDDAGIEIHDVQISADEGILFQAIYQAYTQKKLPLPSMPEVALSISRAMDDPDIDAEQIGRLIQLDPVITGGVIQAANSPLYRGNQHISGIRDALVRIGLQATRDLAISLAMKNIFQTNSNLIKNRMHRLWDRSVHISALSYAIARHVGHLNAEQAMLAGLMHQIGAIPLLTHIASEGMEYTSDELDRVLEKLQALVGVLVVTQWGLDSHCGLIIEECRNWMRDPSPQADISDVVLMAQLIHDNDLLLPALDSVPAWHKLRLGDLDDNQRPQAVVEADADIQAIKQLLGGYS